ncbi:MAG: YraN family protein [Christensenellales bacterium]|mgnify:CR=1 FL=1|jgi:putative endonuclease|nr:YraN family protein [Clostridiales bacterium]
MDKRADGIKAEVYAKRYLQEIGYRILDCNIAYRNMGEIDIVGMDGDCLVIIEVKYRSSDDYGHPLESITKTKRQRMVKATACYLAENKPKFKSIRFDILSITDSGIEHVKNAFFSGWN